MRAGIPGSGLMGGKPWAIFARAGHEVMFSFARSRAKLDRLVSEAGGKVRAGTPAETVKQAEAVLLAAHWSRVDHVLAQAGDYDGPEVADRFERFKT
jgi:8-hydroxy-5-deazaflavin:NADPH oxidoreductase